MKRPRTVRDVVGRGRKKSIAGKPSREGMDTTLAESPGGRINPKWACHHHVLLTLRERLLRDRREQLADAAQPLEPHSPDHADSATDEFDHNLALAALSLKQDALHEIDAAISRIHSGAYGVCEETGKPIPAARLKAIPWARFTREVEAQHEIEGSRRPPRLGALGSVRSTPTGHLESMKSVAAADEDESPATDEALRNDQTAQFGAAPQAGKPRRL
jgi:RNA polymerase-binding protein DksA